MKRVLRTPSGLGRQPDASKYIYIKQNEAELWQKVVLKHHMNQKILEEEGWIRIIWGARDVNTEILWYYIIIIESASHALLAGI